MKALCFRHPDSFVVLDPAYGLWPVELIFNILTVVLLVSEYLDQKPERGIQLNWTFNG